MNRAIAWFANNHVAANLLMALTIVGGLMALERFFSNFSVSEFDIYMGISAGAFLAAPLSAGFSPDELFAALQGQAIHS